MKTIIQGGTIVNEGKAFVGSIVIDGERLLEVREMTEPTEGNLSPLTSHLSPQKIIDATGCYVLPGVIDSHVHFREPGLTEKADIESESRAAAAGGVTTFFDMPNTNPQTTTLEALEQKFELASRKSHVNYSFFFGATNDNTSLFPQLDIHRIPGIKLFMGSSTGNMLVDRDEALQRIFSETPLPLMAHCEDTAIINQNMQVFKVRFGDDPPVWAHQLIRSEDACMASTQKAIELAVKNQTRLHIAHVSTKEELEMIPANCLHSITAEATVGHLLFSTVDYQRLGTRIKVNPAIKSVIDQEALRQGLTDGRISTIGTDHAPHLLSQKEGGCARAASGMPSIQFALPAMLSLVDEGVLTIERLVELMAHNPARIFEVRNRGFLRPGYQADITIVRPHAPWTVTEDIIESKCKWSPFEGQQFQWRVEKTLCNGHLVYENEDEYEDENENGVRRFARRSENEMFGQPVQFR
ncbi:MAG: dihydroorotase [Prevotella sp.]|nr:dihydroorotase [Prevotella sp.]